MPRLPVVIAALTIISCGRSGPKPSHSAPAPIASDTVCFVVTDRLVPLVQSGDEQAIKLPEAWLESFVIQNGRMYARDIKHENVYVFDGTSWGQTSEFPEWRTVRSVREIGHRKLRIEWTNGSSIEVDVPEWILDKYMVRVVNDHVVIWSYVVGSRWFVVRPDGTTLLFEHSMLNMQATLITGQCLWRDRDFVKKAFQRYVDQGLNGPNFAYPDGSTPVAP